jgi:hypothetical protein
MKSVAQPLVDVAGMNVSESSTQSELGLLFDKLNNKNK